MKKLVFIISFLFIGLVVIQHSAAYTISGHITNLDTAVTVTLSGDASMVTETASSGYYEFLGLAGGGNYTITPSKDYTPPQVSITNPAENGSVMGTVEVSVTVRTDYCGYGFDPAEIIISSLQNDQANQDFLILATSCYFSLTNVDYYIDGAILSGITSPPMSDPEATYTWTWDTTDFSDGPHTIKVAAMDENNGTGSDEMKVTVNNNGSLLGDVNLDGNVTIIDALSTAQYYVGIQPSVFDPPFADVNVDDAIDIVDALMIARYYVGLLTELPEAKPGDFGQISANSGDALTAYDFLNDELSNTHPEITLKAIKLAFSQVVSGMNIRLVCSYYSSGTREDQFLSAIIYFNLDMVVEELISLKLDVY